MSILSIMQLVAGLVPTVKGIRDAATSNESVVAKIKDVLKPLAGVLDQVGAFLFRRSLPSCMSRPARSQPSTRT